MILLIARSSGDCRTLSSHVSTSLSWQSCPEYAGQRIMDGFHAHSPSHIKTSKFAQSFFCHSREDDNLEYISL